MQVAFSTTKTHLSGNGITVSLHPQYSLGVAQHEQLLWSMFRLQIREEVVVFPRSGKRGKLHFYSERHRRFTIDCNQNVADCNKCGVSSNYLLKEDCYV